MAPLIAPYHSGMKLGSGFNSYTQQVCIDGAVKNPTANGASTPKEEKKLSQSVVFKTSMIDKMSDVSDALNISGALTIKYNNLIDASGKGTFINSNKVKDADINFLLSVKVINQTVVDHGLTEFCPIDNIEKLDFTQVYGDSFISGFQEGGEFTAIISIKVKDKNQTQHIKANAEVALTTPEFGSGKSKDTSDDKTNPSKPNDPNEKNGGGKPPKLKSQGAEEDTPESPPATTPPEGDENQPKPGDEDSTDDDETKKLEKKNKGLDTQANGRVKKDRIDIFQENEVTISVAYSGGGQDLKKPEEDWNLENMRKAALRFPALVADNPVRTHAFLTKYTSLKDFYKKTVSDNDSKDTLDKKKPLSYDNTALYTATLQDAFLDYKNIYKNIRQLEVDFVNRVKKLEKSTFNEHTEGTPGSSNSTDETNQAEKKDDTSDTVDKPYAPSLAGLENARHFIRRQMNRIVDEVDKIIAKPELASGNQELPCQCPLIFSLYLPVGVPLTESPEGK